MTCRLNIVSSRVHWLFRGVTSACSQDKNHPRAMQRLVFKTTAFCNFECAIMEA